MKKTLLMATLLIGAASYGAAGLNLKFNTDGKFDDDILKDGIFMDFEGDKYGVYKDKKISSGNFFYKEFINSTYFLPNTSNEKLFSNNFLFSS